jgi:hypothetical protein
MSKVIDIEPSETTIEPSKRSELAIVLAPDGKISLNEADVRAEIAQFLADRDEKPEITDDKTYQQAKRTRASIRSRAKELDDARKRADSDLKAVIKDLKAAVDDIKEPLDTREAAYKYAIDVWEDGLRDKRLATLKEHYEGYAGFLVDVLPYARIHRDEWLNQSYKLMQAYDDIEAAANKIAKDDATLDETLTNSGLAAYIPQAKATYFDTLDIGSAIARANALRKADEDAAEFERRKAALAEAAQKAPEPAPEPEPEIIPIKPIVPPSAPSREPVQHRAIIFECTGSQYQAIINHAKQIGVHGKVLSVATTKNIVENLTILEEAS